MSDKSIIQCPLCSQKLRVPIVDNVIVVSCPCNHKFDCIRGSVITAQQPDYSDNGWVFADSLKTKIHSHLPPGWTAWRCKTALCELWYPVDWKIDEGDGKAEILLRPDFSQSIREQNNQFLMTPAFNFFAAKISNMVTISHYLDLVRKDHENHFTDFRLLSEEVAVVNGFPTCGRRYFFRRADQTWEAISVIRFIDKRIYFIDFSGLSEHITENQYALEEVLANVKIYETEQAFESAKVEGLADPSWDVLPESPHLGILFKIDDSPSSNYGDFFRQQIIESVDTDVIKGCRLSAGDVLPKCKYYCMKLEVPNTSVGRYLRERFGQLCLAKGIAPLRNRFVSGAPLDRLSLCFREFIEPAVNRSLSLSDGTHGKSLLLDGTTFPLFDEKQAYFIECENTKQAAMLISFSTFWDILSDGYELNVIDTSVKLLCGTCLRHMPFNFTMFLREQSNMSCIASGEGLPDNLFQAAEKKQCPWCESDKGLMVYDRAPFANITEADLDLILELWAERCRRWWIQNNRDKGVCDRCLESLQRGDGCHTGSDVICVSCASKSASPDKLNELRKNIHYFGNGELRRAKNLKAGLWNFESPTIVKA